MKENSLVIEGLTEKGNEVILSKFKGLKLMKLAFKTAGVNISYDKKKDSLIFSSKKRKIERNQIGMITADFKLSGCTEGKDYKIKVVK
jgi:hypothetical protein